MKQYLIIGYDNTNIETPQRRLDVQQQHFEGLRRLKENGNFLFGGAILDKSGKVIGSSLNLEFESDETMEAWLKSEILFTAKIWETMDIKLFRAAKIQ